MAASSKNAESEASSPTTVPSLSPSPLAGPSQPEPAESAEAKENETGIHIPDDVDFDKPPCPAVVVYIVDPFGQEEDCPEQSVSSLALLKSFVEIQEHVQGDLRKNLILQVGSLALMASCCRRKICVGQRNTRGSIS